MSDANPQNLKSSKPKRNRKPREKRGRGGALGKTKKQASTAQTIGQVYTSQAMARDAKNIGMAVRYVEQLADPIQGQMSRIPDGGAKSTSLLYSEIIYDQDAYADGGPNDGKFAILVRPDPGAIVLGRPASYKVAATRGDMEWPTAINQVDFTQEAVFATNGPAGDLRVDPNSAQMYAYPPCFLEFTGLSDGLGGVAPFATNFNVTSQSYGVAIQLSTTASGDFITMPAGSWLVMMYNVGYTAGQITTISVFGQAQALELTNYFAATDLAHFTLLLVTIPDGNSGIFTSLSAPGPMAPTFISSTFVMAPAYSPESIETSVTSGLVAEIRPVACSALFTCHTSEFQNGGTISAALLPPGAAEKSFFVASPPNQAGGAYEVAGLANFNGAYNGPFKDGAYVFWKPAEIDDFNFYTPREANERWYSTLGIVGQYKLNTPVTVPTTIPAFGRLRVRSIYEVTTVSRFLQVGMSEGSFEVASQALSNLRGIPTSMANGAHLAFLRDLFNRIRRGSEAAWGFYQRNKSIIDPIATAVGKRALTMLAAV